MYDRPFKITGKHGNNAFSFERRNKPALHVPSLIEGGLDDAVIGKETVFEDFDEHGTLKSCVGLKHFVRMVHPLTGKPIVIMDNHNHAFCFWHEAREKGWTKDGATLVHIDQHKDMRRPDQLLSKNDSHDLKKVFEYTNSVLNVGNYILPAIEDGLVGKLISITSENDLKNHKPRTYDSLIVNIDLDFWAPEMDYIDPKLKIRRAKECMEVADLVTIATSPFFIDQPLALRILRELFGPKDL
jgi:hypothetical protein